MKKDQSFSIRARGRSIHHAWEGFSNFLMQEHNARIHLAGTIVAIVLGFLFPLAPLEWIALVVVIGGVWIAELFNTVIENILDFLSPDLHPVIKTIKDLSASAVLVMAFTAVVTGCIVFVPKIIALWNSN